MSVSLSWRLPLFETPPPIDASTTMTCMLTILIFWLMALLVQTPSLAFRSIFQPHRKSGAPRDSEATRTSSTAKNASINGTSPLSKRLQQTFSEEALKETLQWWDDLAPPTFEYKPNHEATIVHFCFLVHGHRGYSRDLAYLQTRMNQRAQELVCGDDACTPSQDMIVHAAVCNERKTTDGVKSGGERLVNEIIQVIRERMHGRKTKTITLSILGNSLGGIYGRYAIARLAEICEQAADDPDVFILDEVYRIQCNVFCTTATPHLGVAGHTFLPIPRTAEIGVAHAMGDTGRDLFRLTDVLLTMATSTTFLKPLGCFRKRIAYANAFGTDFPVPAHTAAFLSTASEYPHHFDDDDSNDEQDLIVEEKGLVVAKVYTPPSSEDSPIDPDSGYDELALMSASLDSLGWKKVFIDVRKEIPKIPLPQLLLRRSSGNDSGSFSDADTGDEIATEQPTIGHLRERRVVGSKDVAAAVTKPLFESDQFHWPVGHNMIVAFSRSRLSSYLNRAGRPFVDGLAKELVKDILSFHQPELVRCRISASSSTSSSFDQ